MRIIYRPYDLVKYISEWFGYRKLANIMFIFSHNDDLFESSRLRNKIYIIHHYGVFCACEVRFCILWFLMVFIIFWIRWSSMTILHLAWHSDRNHSHRRDLRTVWCVLVRNFPILLGPSPFRSLQHRVSLFHFSWDDSWDTLTVSIPC